MKYGKFPKTFYVCITVLLLLGFTHSSEAQKLSHVGAVIAVEGYVSLQRANEQQLKAAHIGDGIGPGTVIICEPDSRVKILMVDENVLDIGPDTRFELREYDLNIHRVSTRVLIDVRTGQIRAKVVQEYDDTQKQFRIRTPYAVSGAPASDFLVSHNPDSGESEVVVFEGFGFAGSKIDKKDKLVGSLQIQPGYFVKYSKAGKKGSARRVPFERLGELHETSRIAMTSSQIESSRKYFKKFELSKTKVTVGKRKFGERSTNVGWEYYDEDGPPTQLTPARKRSVNRRPASRTSVSGK